MQNVLIYPLSRNDRLTHWRDRLCTEAGLVADPVRQVQLDYYDTFDWRLYGAGMCLEAERAGGCTELSLRRFTDRQVEAVQMTDLALLRFPSALPAGQLRRQLEKRLKMRALLPLASMLVRCYTLRDEDGEGKTRARVHLESISLVNANGKRCLLQKRLRLQPLRGYIKAAKRIRTKLENNYRLQTVEDELYSQALAAAGKQPGEYSNKLNLSLQPDMRTDTAVRRILLALLNTMQVNEAGTIADLDSEFLHDFRVAVRRTRSALSELKHVFPPATYKRFKREFAWLGGLTGELRNLDVYLLKFDDYRAVVPAELRDDLEPLRVFLQYKQQQEQSQLVAIALQDKRYRKLKQQWQRYLDSPLPKRPAARDAAKPLDTVVHTRTWRRYRRVLKAGKAITPESKSAELHELRKSCKKLRYLMEFFQSLYPSGRIRIAIRELKQLQDNLGDFQDLDVQITSLQRFAMEMRRRGEYSAATGKAMDALLKTLKIRRHEARDEFEAHFSQFASDSNQARFERLFHAARSDSSAA